MGGKATCYKPGTKIGRWTILGKGKSKPDGRSTHLCQCECGTIREVPTKGLKNGTSTSCGCKHNYKQPHYIDLLGQQFGKLKVIKPTESNKRGLKRWLCQCECGTTIIVNSNDLRTGHTTSCGCRRSKGEEKIGQILTENKISFEKEKIFEDCKSLKRSARFDFWVNNQYLIEYDGIQHYEPTFYTIEFEKTQIRDSNKDQWCFENHIPLIRIPYWHLDKISLNDLLLETSNFVVKEGGVA